MNLRVIREKIIYKSGEIIMKKPTKIRFCTTSLLVIFGLLVCTAVTACNWNFANPNMVVYDTVTYEIGEQFTSVSADLHISDISFIPCDEDSVRVVCYKPQNKDYSVGVNGNTLSITENYEYINFHFFNFNTPTVSVYMPQGDYNALIVSSKTGDTYIPNDFNFESIEVTATTGNVNCEACALNKIKIELSTGDIILNSLNAKDISLSVTTGSINIASVECTGNLTVDVRTGKSNLSNIKCKNLLSNGNTGDIVLKNVIAHDTFNIERSTGDVKFEACDANDITVKTSTGKVCGTLLSEKIFTAKSNTGSVNVPQTTSGGKCNIKTTTGDIKITLR